MNNLDECNEWLIKELIKTDFEEKETGKEIVVKVKYKDLIRMFQKFIKILRG